MHLCGQNCFHINLKSGEQILREIICLCLCAVGANMNDFQCISYAVFTYIQYKELGSRLRRKL